MPTASKRKKHPTPFRPTADGFSLRSLFLVVTLAALCCTACVYSLMWGGVASVVSAIALPYTIWVQRQRALRHEPGGMWLQIGDFLASSVSAVFACYVAACTFLLVVAPLSIVLSLLGWRDTLSMFACGAVGLVGAVLAGAMTFWAILARGEN